jgi:uncharacterized membrane protein YoaK (UPF0700 family)
MDKIDLSRKMRRFTVWLETKNQPDSLVRKKFHGAPFGDAYVTIDPECQTAAGDWVRAAEALGLIALFVIGAAFGSLIVLGRGVHRQPWVLLAEALLLAVAALCYALGLSNLAVAAIVTAMGLESAVFKIEGGGGLGLTYVTGALVKVGQYLAVAVAGGDRLSWVPNFLLWAALVAGGVCGAATYHWINLAAIWFAAGAALALSAIVAATIHL